MSIQDQNQLWTKNFIYMCIINLVMFIGFHMLVSTFPFYIEYLGGDEAIAGLAGGLFSVSSLLMRPFVGWILDNKSRKLLLLFGLAGLIILPFAYTFIPIIVVVLMFRLLHGAFWASSSTSLNTNVSDILPKTRFGEGMGIFGLTTTISLSIAPLIGLNIMEHIGFSALFFASSIMMTVALIISFFTRIKSIQPNKESISIKTIIKNIINKSALPASTVMFLFLIPYGAVNTFIALYADKIQIGSGGLFFAAMALSTGIIRILSGKLSDRKGEGPIVYFAISALGISVLIISCVHSSVMFVAAALLFGFGFGAMVPAMQAMAMRICPPERRGSASSTYLCAFDLGTGLGGVISGFLVRWFGFSSMFKIIIISLILSLFVYIFWARKSPSAFKNCQIL